MCCISVRLIIVVKHYTLCCAHCSLPFVTIDGCYSIIDTVLISCTLHHSGRTVFITKSLYVPLRFTYFTHPYNLLPSGSHCFVLYGCAFACFVCSFVFVFISIATLFCQQFLAWRFSCYFNFIQQKRTFGKYSQINAVQELGISFS